MNCHCIVIFVTRVGTYSHYNCWIVSRAGCTIDIVYRPDSVIKCNKTCSCSISFFLFQSNGRCSFGYTFWQFLWLHKIMDPKEEDVVVPANSRKKNCIRVVPWTQKERTKWCWRIPEKKLASWMYYGFLLMYYMVSSNRNKLGNFI